MKRNPHPTPRHDTARRMKFDQSRDSPYSRGVLDDDYVHRILKRTLIQATPSRNIEVDNAMFPRREDRIF